MIYIIDANNLAGKMKMLGRDHFDKELIEIIKKYNEGKGKKIILVFDGTEPMGDKIEISRTMTVVYSPQDGFYQSADDKICELLERIGGDDDEFPGNEEYKTITEDNDLINRIIKIKERKKINVSVIKSSRFAQTIRNRSVAEEEDKEELSAEEIEKINKELMKIW